MTRGASRRSNHAGCVFRALVRSCVAHEDYARVGPAQRPDERERASPFQSARDSTAPHRNRTAASCLPSLLDRARYARAPSSLARYVAHGGATARATRTATDCSPGPHQNSGCTREWKAPFITKRIESFRNVQLGRWTAGVAVGARRLACRPQGRPRAGSARGTPAAVRELARARRARRLGRCVAAVRCCPWRTERARHARARVVAARPLSERSEDMSLSDRERAEGFRRVVGGCAVGSVWRATRSAASRGHPSGARAFGVVLVLAMVVGEFGRRSGARAFGCWLCRLGSRLRMRREDDRRPTTPRRPTGRSSSRRTHSGRRRASRRPRRRGRRRPRSGPRRTRTRTAPRGRPRPRDRCRP
jgi:hypothetical protein